MWLKNTFAALGTIVAVLLMITALWAWGGAGAMAGEATRPEVERWAVRSAAVAVAAVSQLLLLTFVAGRLFEPRRFGADVLRLTVGVVAAVAIVSAVALGLAGR
jgi:hypothetical protein